MGVNAQLSSISDVFYQGAFITYILCLLVSLYYYGFISEILRKRIKLKPPLSKPRFPETAQAQLPKPRTALVRNREKRTVPPQ